LVNDDTDPAEALAFVDELIDAQVIVSDLQLPVTGEEPLPALVRELAAVPAATTIAKALAETHASLKTIDSVGFAGGAKRYRLVAESLKGLGIEPELDRLFQVDLVRPALQAKLGQAIVDEIKRGVELLRRIGRGQRRDPLERFREAFLARYEGRAVPLLEALDEEMGLGGTLADTGDPSPLLRRLPAREEPEPSVPWGKRQEHLITLLGQALSDGAQELVLGPEDVERLAEPDPPPLPPAFEVASTIFASSPAAMARGDYRLHLEWVGAPPAGRLLGRFCHADPALAREMVELLETEARHEPEAIFAEIVHLPEGRLGNILLRPVLRSHEITYLGRSGAPMDRQIPATDVMLSLENGRLVLRSARLGRRVIPRLTTAHYVERSLGVYRFLCLLQHEGVGAGVRWEWGALETAPFLPRVRAGRLILSLARWRMTPADAKRLIAARGAERYRRVQEWRGRHRLLRWVALVEGDNRLPVDLDNILSVEAFAHLLKADRAAVLEEVHLGPDDLCVEGPDGRYTHELVVPFVRPLPKDAPPHETRTARLQPSDSISRRLIPGSEWLYVKLYTSPELADDVLVNEIGPVTRELLEIGAADGWFFIRFGDPDWHVRWRLRGDPGAVQKTVLPAVQAAAARLLERGLIWRFQLDTYEREVERYGGAHGMLLSERLFQVDSEAALEILEALEPGDAGLDERWRLALRGMGDLLADLGLDLGARLAWVKRALAQHGKLVGPGGNYHAWANERYRAERARLEGLFDTRRDPAGDLEPGLAALRRRSERLAPLIAELKALEQAGRLGVAVDSLAGSYLHMQGFRLLRSAQGDHEPVLLDFLGRIYQSQAARAASGEPSRDPTP
jgi:thiopeptide-type bacteriocin biosynthesis protein